jgi:hypothetical protein
MRARKGRRLAHEPVALVEHGAVLLAQARIRQAGAGREPAHAQAAVRHDGQAEEVAQREHGGVVRADYGDGARL